MSSNNPGAIRCSDKPCSGVMADGVHDDSIHSAAVVLTELGADVVQANDFLRKLDVVAQVVGVAQVVEDVDDLLLLAQELLGHLFACLLTLLLRSDLGSLLALLDSFLSGSLALAAGRFALNLARHGGW